MFKAPARNTKSGNERVEFDAVIVAMIKDEEFYPRYMFTDAMISNYPASKWWLIV